MALSLTESDIEAVAEKVAELLGASPATATTIVHDVATGITDVDKFVTKVDTVPETPAVPAVQATPDIPATPGTPAVPAVPGTPAVPATATSPGVAAVLGTPAVAAVPAHPAVSGTPGSPAIAAIPAKVDPLADFFSRFRLQATTDAMDSLRSWLFDHFGIRI